MLFVVFAALFLSTGMIYPNKSFYILLCIFSIASVRLRNEDGQGKNPSPCGTGLLQYRPQHVSTVMQSPISRVL